MKALLVRSIRTIVRVRAQVYPQLIISEILVTAICIGQKKHAAPIQRAHKMLLGSELSAKVIMFVFLTLSTRAIYFDGIGHVV